MKIPRHIAIIMDGNGRWARERDLPRIKGHEAGTVSVRAVTEECVALGVQYLTVYAFSTENWRRPPEEVAALFALLEIFIEQETPTLMRNNVRLRTIGRTHELPATSQAALAQAIERTAGNTAMTMILALNYSGRTEIEDAMRAIGQEIERGELKSAEITQETVAKRLYTAEYPDPDLLIRTSGELRLSNFLLWQLSYTEIHVTQKLWPDFGKEDLRAAVEDFTKRERRFGGL
ncbi:MAG TPA: isoprenyl transferase [Chthoniobacteraceae bacterium]|jgi:undecaprenyl diphosphate synthase|nr:isoprenyl transferase [Chthoniobacteraceae bacterium]